MPEASNLLFGLDETGATAYRSDEEYEFLSVLHDGASAHGWFGDAWHTEPDRTIVTVTLGNPVSHTLRIDFLGDEVIVGYDETHQLVSPIPESDTRTRRFASHSVSELARFASDWVHAELCSRSARSR